MYKLQEPHQHPLFHRGNEQNSRITRPKVHILRQPPRPLQRKQQVLSHRRGQTVNLGYENKKVQGSGVYQVLYGQEEH